MMRANCIVLKAMQFKLFFQRGNFLVEGTQSEVLQELILLKN